MDLIRALEAHLEEISRTPAARRNRARAGQGRHREQRRSPDRTVRRAGAGARLPTMFSCSTGCRHALADVWADEENAPKGAASTPRAFEDLRRQACPSPPAQDAAASQDEQRSRPGRALLYQARATDHSGRQRRRRAAGGARVRAYPDEETARGMGRGAVRAGPARRGDRAPGRRVRHSRSARHRRGSQPRPPALGEMYRKLHGSEKGLGDLILAAYDRTSAAGRDAAQEAAARSIRTPRLTDPHASSRSRAWTATSCRSSS